MRRAICVALVAIVVGAAPVRAHPVPKSNHDRKIAVRLTPSERPDHVAVRIDYRLEVDETTVLLEDMLPFKDEVDFLKYRNKPLDFYAEYMRIYAPILAGNLRVTLDGKPLVFSSDVRERSPRLSDEMGQPLGHLRCDFVFRAEAAVEPGKEHAFAFREGNFLLQEGLILASFANEAGFDVRSLQAPDEKLQQRAVTEQLPGDDDRLREIQAMLAVSAKVAPPPVAVSEPAPAPPEDQDASAFFSEGDSLYSVIAGDANFWWKMLLATLFGAAHALTPGHGKTLVAAYLIGQRGTVRHACVLGLVTTLTHTGAVLILAGILFFLPNHLKSSFAVSLQHGLGLVAGLMVVCLGAWLLLQRLSGRADHIHVGGSHHHHGDHHHHHHGAHDHTHAHAHAPDGTTEVRWWGLIVLGITGGLIPCWDAIILFLYFVGRGEFWTVLPALVCFSAGLAAVLVLIGVMVVQVPRFATSHFGEGRLVHALPIVSALVIIAMGIWLCTKVTLPPS
jgi:ABC-type nickel/cobalt efflux system permease component RcnA